jgi:hypothetical protein
LAFKKYHCFDVGGDQYVVHFHRKTALGGARADAAESDDQDSAWRRRGSFRAFVRIEVLELAL